MTHDLSFKADSVMLFLTLFSAHCCCCCCYVVVAVVVAAVTGPLEEDEINAMIKEQEGDIDVDLGGPLTCAERLVRMFLEGAAVILPCSSGSGSPASREAR